MYTVYIGEDTPSQALYLSGILRHEERLRTIVFGNGLNLLLAIHQEPPALIISDVLLPSLSGVALSRLVKFHDDTHKIPLILISSIPTDQIHSFDSCSADAFLPKPISGPDLLTKVWQLLEPVG